MKFHIRSIELANYRPYRGRHKVSFSYENKKNVCIIKGQNGAGKSNILNALTWCLYGSEIHSGESARDSNSLPIINSVELESLKPGDVTYAEVSLSLETETGPWKITRTLKGGKNAKGEKYIAPIDELTITYRVGNQDIVTNKGTEPLVNNILPEALKPFFFIDGEQLREFFRYSNPDEIAAAIDTVSQLTLLEKAEKHLHLVQKDIQTDVKASNPKTVDVINKINEMDTFLEQIEKRKEKTKDALEKDSAELREISVYLENHNSAVISQLGKELAIVESDIKRLDVEIYKRKNERDSYLVQVAPYIFLYKDIKKALEILDKAYQDGEIPRKIAQTFIQELLERGKCICGKSIDSKSREELVGYAERLQRSEVSGSALEMKFELHNILKCIGQFPEKIHEMELNLQDLDNQSQEKKRRNEEISDLLSESNLDEILLKEERRKQLHGLISDEQLTIKACDQGIADRNEKRKEYERELEIENEKDDKNKKLNKKLKLVRNTLSALEQSICDIRVTIRELVQLNTNENFKKLIRSSGTKFDNIVIDPQYQVYVNHITGYNALNNLSAGEYLILGLSFMSSLMKISGFHAPVIIDTPLGKIDDIHRKHITEDLPKFLEDTQLIFLVTPTEYDPVVQANLSKYLVKSNYYEISENEKNTESMVGERIE